MAESSKHRDYALLEREIQTTEYRNLLTFLQREEPFLRRFSTWLDVIAFMRGGSSRDPSKDAVLRPILYSHREDEDHHWRTILLTIFWPGLMSIHSKKCHWDPDEPDELWQRIFWSFHESVCRIDVSRRPHQITSKLINDTIHRLFESYRRDWIHVERVASMDPTIIQEMSGAVDGIDFDCMELREVHEREISRLQEHCRAGRITEADFFLIVGTRLYGQSIAEHAREVGLSREAAKKRRQRAEARIHAYEEETEKG